MTELQTKLLDMLKAFHEVCVKENLRYYLLGGTALGAARHQGFIPWDDDIDVGMPRADYERLKSISLSLTTDNYCFEFPGAKDFVYPFGKMYDKKTTLTENTRYKTKRGIYVDIFPLDGAGNTYDEGLSCFKPIVRKVNLLSAKVCAWRKGRKLYKNLGMLVLRYLPVGSMRGLTADIEKLSKKHDFDECAYAANYVGAWYEKELVKKEFFGTPTLRKFEGQEVYCPEKTEEYLTAIYGDWRKLPPKDKQRSHHDYLYLSLEESYIGE